MFSIVMMDEEEGCYIIMGVVESDVTCLHARDTHYNRISHKHTCIYMHTIRCSTRPPVCLFVSKPMV